MNRLYHVPLSPFCRKVRLTLAEKRMEVELVEERYWEGSPDFLRRNPAGKVPILRIGNRMMSESQAICEYLEEAVPAPQLMPRDVDGRPLRHALEVRDPAAVDADFIELARRHQVATVFTDSTDYPSFADLTADFVYARLMRSQPIETGYPPNELAQWAERARAWSRGEDIAELPHVGEPAPVLPRRDVFVYFISSAKERNPAAAMAMIRQLAK